MPFGASYSGQYREGPGFADHVTDTQTNLTYTQQRYYDPIAQRFLSPDPVGVSGADGGTSIGIGMLITIPTDLSTRTGD